MQTISIAFDMTDAVFSAAVREACVKLAREQVKAWHLLLFAACAGILLLASVTGSWLDYLAAVPLALLLVFALCWVAAWLWLPVIARRRVAHLPHRRVTVELADATLAFQTANERLEVRWEELKALEKLPNFWLVCLRSGARIPVPASVVPSDAVSLLRSKALAMAAK